MYAGIVPIDAKEARTGEGIGKNRPSVKKRVEALFEKKTPLCVFGHPCAFLLNDLSLHSLFRLPAFPPFHSSLDVFSRLDL
jgi:hypothetical protein